MTSPEPLCGAVAGFTMPEYLIGFHQPIIDSAVSFWPDTTYTNAGIFRIIFIIRKDVEGEFKEVIGNRIEKNCAEYSVEVFYAYQSLTDIPSGLPEGRTKPWGTGQAVLAAKDLINTPFAVINADDYYGKEAYVSMHDWLCESHEPTVYSMAGFILKNTLSDNSGVTHGVCQVEVGHTHVTDVVETSNIVKTATGAEADGAVLDLESFVSMNFWGFPGNPPEFLNVLETVSRSSLM